jgi:hypothetical protein
MRSVLLKFPSKEALLAFKSLTEQTELTTNFEFSINTFIGALADFHIQLAYQKFGAVEVNTRFEEI